MLKNVSLYLTFIFCLSVPFAKGQPFLVDSLFEQGNRAYQEENYSKAIDYYNQIIDSGIKNHKVYYNLANAYFRADKLGRAILNYNRALKLNPRDEDILANLRYVRLFVIDKLKEQPSNFLAKGVNRFLNLWNLNELNLIFILSYFLLAGLLVLKILSNIKERVFDTVVLVFVILFIASGLSFGLKLYDVSFKRAVVIEDEVGIRSGPGEDWTLQLVAHQGLELKVRGKAEGWYQVSLPNQLIGWVPEGAVEKI